MGRQTRFHRSFTEVRHEDIHSIYNAHDSKNIPLKARENTKNKYRALENSGAVFTKTIETYFFRDVVFSKLGIFHYKRLNECDILNAT